MATTECSESCHIVIGASSKFHLFLAGTATLAETGTVCTTDFVVIPNLSQNSVSLNTDRFCGKALVPTTSKYSVHTRAHTKFLN